MQLFAITHNYVYNRAISEQLFDSREKLRKKKKLAQLTHHVIQISQTGISRRLFFSFVNVSFPKCIRTSDSLRKIFCCSVPLHFFVREQLTSAYRVVSHKFTGSADCDLLSEWKLFLRPCCTYVAAPTAWRRTLQALRGVFQRTLYAPL